MLQTLPLEPLLLKKVFPLHTTHNLHKATTHVRGQSEAEHWFPFLGGGTCPLNRVRYWNTWTEEARLKGGTAGIDDGHILTLTVMKRRKAHSSAKAALLLAQVKDPALVLTATCRSNRVVSRFNDGPNDDKQTSHRRWLQTRHPVLTAVVLPSWVFLCCESNGFHPAPDSWSRGVLNLRSLKSNSRLTFTIRARKHDVAGHWRVKSERRRKKKKSQT